jgi:hypothetical protein
MRRLSADEHLCQTLTMAASTKAVIEPRTLFRGFMRCLPEIR